MYEQSGGLADAAAGSADEGGSGAERSSTKAGGAPPATPFSPWAKPRSALVPPLPQANSPGDVDSGEEDDEGHGALDMSL